MRDFKHSRDIYSQVHAKSMNMFYEGRVPKDIFDTLSKIFKEHKVINDSPFVNQN